MKTHFYTILLLTLVWILQGTGLLMGEDQKELPPEDSNPRLYSDGSDGIRRYTRLQAHGDYTKLKLVVRSGKPDYNLGEHVWLKFFVRNDSDSEVHIWLSASMQNRAHLWKLFHSNYDEVVKTPKLEEIIIQNRKLSGRYVFELPQPRGGGLPRYIKLQPGQEVELHWMCLNDLFDLSKPDTYELTCFTESFTYGQYYEPLMQSNTLTFRVLEEPVAADYWLRDGVTQRGGEPQHVPYTNPPLGEEVFKQPKPPKNVFYLSGTGEIIDVSPYTYYRERAKAQEAQTGQPPDVANPPTE